MNKKKVETDNFAKIASIFIKTSKWIFSRNAIIFIVICTCVLTYLSTFLYQKEFAITSAGIFDAEQARELDLPTRIYGGWPDVIFHWRPSLVSGRFRSFPDRLIQSFFANMFMFLLFSVTAIPTIKFWGIVSFILVNFGRLLALVLKSIGTHHSNS